MAFSSTSTAPANAGDLLKLEDAEDLLGVSARTLRRWAARGQDPLPVSKRGRQIYLVRSDLIAWIRRGSRKPRRAVPIHRPRRERPAARRA